MTDIDPMPSPPPANGAPSGAATDAGNAAPTPEVRAMFDRSRASTTR